MRTDSQRRPMHGSQYRVFRGFGAGRKIEYLASPDVSSFHRKGLFKLPILA